MALNLCQNLVSAQYLENQLIECHQILYMDLYWQDLALYCYTLFMHINTRIMALDFREISFPLNILGTKQHIFSKFYV